MEHVGQISFEGIGRSAKLSPGDPDRAPTGSRQGTIALAVVLEHELAGVRVAAVELHGKPGLSVETIDDARAVAGHDRRVGGAHRKAALSSSIGLRVDPAVSA
jgi:hypothetical protein